MPRLICNVRDCANPLTAKGSTLGCDQRHSFDRARSGYWNLLQPQDRRSSAAGDRDDAVDARERWLERGHVASLADRIAELAGLARREDGATVLDVGCGTGWFLDRFAGIGSLDLCGIDLSTRAAARAARRFPDGSWIVANADRRLPLADASVDVALSIFGRRPAAELARVLRPGGCLVVVVPGGDDLAELREAAQGEALATDRTPRVVEEFAGTGLRQDLHESWRRCEAHDREGIDELLAMTYRGVRHRDRERLVRKLADCPTLEVTLAAELLRFG